MPINIVGPLNQTLQEILNAKHLMTTVENKKGVKEAKEGVKEAKEEQSKTKEEVKEQAERQVDVEKVIAGQEEINRLAQTQSNITGVVGGAPISTLNTSITPIDFSQYTDNQKASIKATDALFNAWDDKMKNNIVRDPIYENVDEADRLKELYKNLRKAQERIVGRVFGSPEVLKEMNELDNPMSGLSGTPTHEQEKKAANDYINNLINKGR